MTCQLLIFNYTDNSVVILFPRKQREEADSKFSSIASTHFRSYHTQTIGLTLLFRNSPRKPSFTSELHFEKGFPRVTFPGFTFSTLQTKCFPKTLAFTSLRKSIPQKSPFSASLLTSLLHTPLPLTSVFISNQKFDARLLRPDLSKAPAGA